MIGASSKTCLVLALLGGVIALLRLHTYHEPFERDICTYAVVAREMLAGRELYSDVWDIKPPAVYLTYAAAQLVAGDGPGGVYLLGVAASIVTMLGVYYAGSRGGARPATGLWSAALWTAIQCTLMLQANQPNSEVFINACIVWVFALLVSADDRGFGWVRTVIVGVLFAWATLYKQVAITHAIIFGILHVALPPRGEGNRRRAVGQVLLMALIGAAAWSATIGYFALAGRLGHFWEANVTYNQYYAGAPGAQLLRWVFYEITFATFRFLLWPVAVLALIGFLGFLKRFGRQEALLVGWIGATVAAVALPGYLFPHYFQFWLPVLAVAGGRGLEVLSTMKTSEAGGPARGPILAALSGTAALVLLALYQWDDYRMEPEEWVRQKYGSRADFHIEARRTGLRLDELLSPGETFFHWGDEIGLYFYSRRPPPSGVMWSYHMLYGPLVDRHAERVIRDLARRPPELIIARKDLLDRTGHQVVQWFLQRYDPVAWGDQSSPFQFFRRNNGDDPSVKSR